MMRRLCLVVFLAASASLMSTSAYAAFDTPAYIGWYDDNNKFVVQFGGTGIVGSNSQLVYDEVDLGNGQFVRLAMMAHGRYGYSETVDVNTERYYVETGKYGGTDDDKDYAKWNFGWYVWSNVDQLLGVRLSYDFDPGIDSDPLNYVWFIANFSQIPDTTGDKGDPDTLDGEAEDSWNLAMSFLSSPQSSTNPPGGVLIWQKTEDDEYLAFDPNVPGEYTFKLAVFSVTPKVENGQIVFQWATEPLGGIEMRVNAVPEPATLVGLASLGASGLGAVVLRRRKKA